ncbi:hypothetical protein L596_017917 [Steinernema carpocapsae]|uniref:STAS domain-containing protein n=1 Tax=Steinernema carpocapsae TaxID=34508 RepID=A0A4U5N3E0_STECR|nr:hypothetical protein L596_017917 [Steinernema carpocapsae]
MNQAEFDERYERVATSEENANVDPKRKIAEFCSPKALFARILGTIPILQWLPRYNVKEDFSGDLIGGLTVGIMHVPQGMAYASLANVPPVYGLYSSFFASTIYMFFGTSRHISIGVFAVASMMVGAVRLRLVPDAQLMSVDVNGTMVEQMVMPKGALDVGYEVTPMMLCSTLTLTVGLIQLVMGALRLGFLTTYMSDQLISGFTTGAAAHVFMSQLNKVLGVSMPRHSGIGMLLYMLRDMFFLIPKTNFMALGLSTFGIVFLVIGRDYVNPVVKKFSPVPLPLELILVIIGTIFSQVMNVKDDYHLKIVDHIPRGVPEPSLPKLDLIPHVAPDAASIAVICFMFVMSMGKLFAKKHKYKTDATQELYAVGMMEVLSSFFPVYPCGASLSRSAVCEMSGAKTQLYTLFSSALLLVVIIWLGPLLEPLPMCILACIVIVSLKSLFMQCKELPKLWKTSKFDFAIWMASCMSTIVTDVTTGLIISVVFVLVTIVLREQWPKMYNLAMTPNKTVFKSASAYRGLQKLPENLEILKFDAPLHFVNVTKFLDQVAEILNADHEDLELVVDNHKRGSIVSIEVGTALGDNYKPLAQLDPRIAPQRTLIVDCAAIAYADTMGIDAFKSIYVDAKKADVLLLFADLSESVYTTLLHINYIPEVIPKDRFYPTVEEALKFAMEPIAMGDNLKQ